MAAGVSSRYRGMAAIDAPAADGSRHPTLPARLPPAEPAGATPYYYVVLAGDSIELLAYRFLGSSEAWWQIADANPGLFPADLRPGSTLVIPTAVDAGRVVRSRTF